MITDTIRKTAILSLATLIAGGALAACATSATEDQPLDVAGASAELRDNDGDGHDDYNDQWRFKGKKGDQGRRRNICPLVEGFAQPNSIQVGQSTKVFGYSIDFDGPKRLVSKWTVSDPTMGTFANASSKRTTFKCLKAGVAHLSFTGYDGDCLRQSRFNVYCKGTTPSTCGDGKIDPNETCDGNCPTTASCNDGNPCTKDVLSGDATKCTAVCAHTAVTTCTNGDGCCLTDKCSNPATPNHGADNDCTVIVPECGNGVLDSGETCDNSTTNNKCPTSCSDGNSCTTDTLTGNAASCTAKCTTAPITTCTSGDGCCLTATCSNPASPNHGLDTDCTATGPVCGNGVVETPETCDPLASCPTTATCNDNNACTTDTLTGDPAACTSVCTHTAVTTCVSGDGACCGNCLHPLDGGTDSDCVPTNKCGNGTLDTGAGETCDNSSSTKCPTTCNDTNACTTDTLTGTAAACNVKCTNVAINTCDNANTDGCCNVAAGCTANNDRDCGPTCGNGTIEAGETCDPLSSCPTSCTDGNACTIDKVVNPGTCNATCDSSTKITTCVTGDQCCPSGCTHPADGGTDSDCTQEPVACGNGKLDGTETCDNTSPTKCPTTCNDSKSCTSDVLEGTADACNVRCTNSAITACTAPTGDSCCPSLLDPSSTCNAINDIDCLPVCGNGAVEGSEICDGNCPASCDDNNPCTDDTRVVGIDACHVTCTHVPTNSATCNCGNGKLDSGETCDNSDPANQCPPSTCDDNNACTNDVATGSAGACTLVCSHPPVSSPTCNCNNGKLDVGETCDNSSPNAAEKCPTTCAPSTDACAPVVLTGSATTCSVECVAQPITTCANGDGCCAPGCTHANDDTCPGDLCNICETSSHGGNNSCPNALRSCQNLTGVTSATSPMPGVSKGALCQQIVDCIHSSHCAQNFNVTDCICGTDVQPDLCFAGTYDAATGPCKALIAAGAESNLMPVIAANFSDASFAIGAADTLIESCDYLSCNECL